MKKSEERISSESMLDGIGSNGVPVDKGTTKKRANDLSGKEWTRYSISVWDDIRKRPEESRLGHPAMFPIELVKRLILSYTRSDEKVILDPFAGVGSTLMAAKELNRSGIGIELNEDFVAIANKRLSVTQHGLFDEPTTGEVRIINANAFDLLEYVPPSSVDMVVTSPPYWDILEQKRTADYKKIRNYGDKERDLGKITDYREFLDRLKEVFSLVYTTMKPGKYCVVVVMDLRKKDRFYPFHSDIANFMQEIGFIFDDLFIWNRASEYNNLRPLGYPSVFRVNKVHEYCLVFKKPN